MVQIDVMEANSRGLTVQRIRVSTCILGVIPMWFCFQEASRVENYFLLTFEDSSELQGAKTGDELSTTGHPFAKPRFSSSYIFFFLLSMAWNWHWATCWQIIPGKALSTP